MKESLKAELQGNLKVVKDSFSETAQSRRNDFENISDDEIWAKFKAGNEAAFVFIFQKYYDTLFTFCFQFTKKEELIKDCIQDLFVYLRSKRDSISQTNNIRLYLLKCCKNRLVNYLKAELKVKALDELEEKMLILETSSEDNIISLQSKEIEEKRLKAAMAKLSLKEREIIYYFYFENMDYQSIAELFGYEHVKSVRSLLYKTLSKLKDLF